MSRLNPEKLHATIVDGTPVDKLVLPRIYTLTHSDFSGDLYLTIGPKLMKKQISGLYTRFMRDEVWAEWIDEKDAFTLIVHCHVSGGLVLGSAGWRYEIFRQHMPLVLAAFRYGDRKLFESNPQLEEANIKVSFHADQVKFNRMESWHTFMTSRF